jgi:hypothetical protein
MIISDLLISFDVFCDSQFLSGDDRQAFRQWLGVRANQNRTHSQWWVLFAEYVRK